MIRALENNFFNFDGRFFKQVDGVTMGSILNPSLANSYLCFHEKVRLNDCAEDFKSVHYKIHDMFVLFHSLDDPEKFKSYLNSKHKNIKFSLVI